MTASKWLNYRPHWFRHGFIARIFIVAYCFLSAPFKPTYLCTPSQVRVFIIVRDVYSTLSPLIDQLNAEGILNTNIYLIDTGSTSMQCISELSRLASIGCKILYVKRDDQPYGPYALWLSRYLVKYRATLRYPFIVTDSDIGFPDSYPEKWLNELFIVLNSFKCVDKVSLPLSIQDIDHPRADVIVSHERSLYYHPLYSALSFFYRLGPSAPSFCSTDTTLSLYRNASFFTTFSIRLSSQWAVNHLPWYSRFFASEEYSYYRANKLCYIGSWS